MIVPPYLPDTVNQGHPLTDVWRWQHAFDISNFTDPLLDPHAIVEQRVAFFRAHQPTEEGSIDAFDFSPPTVNVGELQDREYASASFELARTNTTIPFVRSLAELEKVMSKSIDWRKIFVPIHRPDYGKEVVFPTTTPPSFMNYGPVVLHNASIEENNGWYYVFRQKIARSPSYVFPTDKDSLKIISSILKSLKRRWPSFKYTEYRVRLEIYARYPKAAAIYFGQTAYDEASMHNYRPVSRPESEAWNQANDFLNTIYGQVINAINNYPHRLVFDDRGQPVFEDVPYLVITVQVHRAVEWVRMPSTSSWNLDKEFVISVPPYLNVAHPGTLNVDRNNRQIDWSVLGPYSSLVELTFIEESHHRIAVAFKYPGSYRIIARITTSVIEREETGIRELPGVHPHVTYLFVFNVRQLSTRYLEIDPRETTHLYEEIVIPPREEGLEYSVEEEEAFLNISDKWVVFRFRDDPLMSMIKDRLLDDIPDVLDEKIASSFKRSENPFKRVDNTDPFMYRYLHDDFRYNFVMVSGFGNRNYFVLLAVFVLPSVQRINIFGEKITFVPYYPPYSTTSYTVLWKRDRNHYLVDNTGEKYRLRRDKELTVAIHRPKDLGEYEVEVHDASIPPGDPLYTILFTVLPPISVQFPGDLIYDSLMIDIDRPGEQISREKEPFKHHFVTYYARKHLVNLSGYWHLYPFIDQYVSTIEHFLKTMDTWDQVIVSNKLPPGISELLPEHLRPPYLFVSLGVPSVVASTESVFYVIFDPLVNRWINVLALNTDNQYVTDPKLLPHGYGHEPEKAHGIMAKASLFYVLMTQMSDHVFMSRDRVGRFVPSRHYRTMLGTEYSTIRSLTEEVQSKLLMLQVNRASDYQAGVRNIIDSTRLQAEFMMDETMGKVFESQINAILFASSQGIL
jgi:hypothetical protein